MDAHVTWGIELPEECWMRVAERIMESAPTVASILEETDGKEAAENYMTDMGLACMAISHVAKFARDKCRIIPVPDKDMS